MRNVVKIRPNNVREIKPNTAIRIKRIAIVGQGAAGAAAKSELVRQAIDAGIAEQLEIFVFEPRESKSDGQGIAWSASTNSLLVNMPVPTVSFSYGNPREIGEALGRSMDEEYSSLFPPRKHVGGWLKAFSQSADDIAKIHGIPIFRIEESVTDIMKTDWGWTLLTPNGQFDADSIVVAIGNIPSTKFSYLRGLPGYMPNVWEPEKRLQNIGKADDVILLGSSVTAIDAVVTLVENGHHGKITMLSRHGRLPGVRVRHDPGYKLRLLSADLLNAAWQATDQRGLSLEALQALVLGEFLAADVALESLFQTWKLANSPHLAWLGHGLAVMETKSQTFSVLKALDSIFPDLWHCLSEGAKREYLQKYHSDYSRIAWPMAPENARKIYKMLSSGQLKVIGGALDPFHDGRRFVIPIENGSNVSHKSANILINATGIGGALDMLDCPLVRNMRQRGLIHPHKFGGAISDFTTGQLLNSHKKSIGSIYVTAGALNRGERLLTNVLTEAAESGVRAAQAAFHNMFQQISRVA